MKSIRNHFLFLKLILLWSIAFIAIAYALSKSDFKSQSNDSKYYAEQVVRYYDKSWQEIITPKWGENYWGFDPNTYMRDQFPGQLIIGATGAKLGLTPKHAQHIIQMFFQLGSIFLLFFVARKFIAEEHSFILFLGLLLISNAFSYNLRANHESGITFFSCLSLYAGLSFIDRKLIAFLFYVIASIFLLLIKGPFVVFAFILFNLGAFFSLMKDFKNHHKFAFIAWGILFNLAAVMAAALVLWWYEVAFTAITKLSFLEEFYRIQFKERALDVKDQYPYFIQRGLNFFYYFYHTLTYALPWTIGLLIALYLRIKNQKKLSFVHSHLSYLLILSAMAFCAVFSTSNRMAGRYVYPAYYIVAAWMILFCYFNFEFMQRWLKKSLNNYYIYLVVGLWSLSFIIKLF